MKDERKTKKQLIQELDELRREVAELGEAEVERVRAEEALRESREHLQLAIDATRIAVWD